MIVKVPIDVIVNNCIHHAIIHNYMMAIFFLLQNQLISLIYINADKNNGFRIFWKFFNFLTTLFLLNVNHILDRADWE